jgi:hypothetical protein
LAEHLINKSKMEAEVTKWEKTDYSEIY